MLPSPVYIPVTRAPAENLRAAYTPSIIDEIPHSCSKEVEVRETLYPSVIDIEMLSEEKQGQPDSPTFYEGSNSSFQHPDLLVANAFLYTKERIPGKVQGFIRVEDESPKPYILNIQSRQLPEEGHRSVQGVEYELEQDLAQDFTQDEDEGLEPLEEVQKSLTESRQSKKSQSNKSIEMFDSKKFGPVLKKLKKTLQSKRRKSKKPKAVKWDEYSHVPSKVAQIINGSFIEKPKKIKKKRLAKSVPRAKRRNFVLVKHKKCKKNKRLAKSKTTKVVPESEEITESAISAQPLNIRTEVAVKLFPETPRKQNTK